MTSWKLVFEPVWSWPVTVLAAAVVLASVPLLYHRGLRRLARPWRWTLSTLRLVAAVVLALALFRPTVQVTETSERSASVLVLTDASRSMTIADEAGGTTRRQRLVRTLQACEAQWQTLGERVHLEYFDFDSELRAVERPDESAPGEQTALGAALDEVFQRSLRERIAAVFLLTDGAQRARPPLDVDPRPVARKLGQRQVPIYAVPFGQAGFTDTAVDVAVEDLQVDPVVFQKKAVPVSAKLRVSGGAGREVTVRLLVEDRTGRGIGESGPMVQPPASEQAATVLTVRPRTNNEVIPVNLSFVAEQTGELKVAVEAVPLAGELREANNRQTTLVTVRAGGLKVAYFDKVRPENKAVRLLSRSPDIQLDTCWVRSGRFRKLTRIDESWFEPGRYDVYILGDVPASVFGPRLLQKLAARVDEGAGLLMLGGFHSFGPGGYAATPLADCLPVRMRRLETQPEDSVDPTLHYDRLLKMKPTRAGLRHFVMRLASPEENEKAWAKLPPLLGANRLQKKNEFVEVLAESEDGVPLLFAHEYGKARVLAFAADTTYLWLQHGFATETLRFWQQLVYWLARKELPTGQNVWARVEPRRYPPQAKVTVEFGARDANGQLVPDAQYQVRVLRPDGQSVQLTPQRTPKGGTATFAQTALPGDYWVVVSASKQGRSLGLDGVARFLVEQRDLELDNPAADRDLLAEIAAASGGSAVTPEELSSFLARLLEQGWPNLREKRVRRVSLWDNWFVLAVFVAALSAEWFLRKSRGLV